MAVSSPVFRQRSQHRTHYGCCGRSAKVEPQEGNYPLYDIREIRPGRKLRVRHVAPHEIVNTEQNKNFSNDGIRNVQLKTQSSQGKGARTTTATSIQVSMVSGSRPSDPDRKDFPVFFIHGVGGSSDVFQSQIDYFSSEGFELIIPDLIGHGFSQAPKDRKAYHFNEIAKDLIKIFDTYGKNQNIVVGHSYGASFAAVLSRERSEKVYKLILISGGSPTPLAPQGGLFSCPPCFLTCCRPVIKRGFNKSAFHNTKELCIPMDGAFDVPMYVLKYIMMGQEWPGGNTDYHKKITCPTLLIHGQHDGFVTVEDEEEMMETVEDCILMVIDGASHMVMLEQPEKVNALIHEFINISLDQINTARSQRDSHAHTDSRTRSSSTLSLRSVKSIPNNFISHNFK